MITETIFATSFIGIIFMLGSKLAEQRFGTFHWWSKFARWGDAKVHLALAFIVRKYQLYKKIAFLFFFEFLPAFAYHKTVELKDYLHKKYYESRINLKGEKRLIRSNGTVSEFLQNIKKDDVTTHQTMKSLDVVTEEKTQLK